MKKRRLLTSAMAVAMAATTAFPGNVLADAPEVNHDETLQILIRGKKRDMHWSSIGPVIIARWNGH